MQATKESCQDAIRRLERLQSTLSPTQPVIVDYCLLIREFLAAAYHRLPSDAARTRDAARRKNRRNRG